MKKYIEDMTREELREVWADAISYVDDLNIGEYLYNMNRRAASYDISYSGQYFDGLQRRGLLEF